MGVYLNPGNTGFKRILSSQYVDKTGLISLMNQAIGTTKNLVCISRPRRFGKSYAAQMLLAYYDKTCDSEDLFRNLRISSDASFMEHLNHYNVIYLDMTSILGSVRPEELTMFISENVTEEQIAAYPGLKAGNSFDQTLLKAVEYTGNRFIAIIDEWDAPIRETPQIEEQYLKFLRMLFKGSGTTARIFAAAYMTGILPIKKDGSQSAISDFEEYTMLEPGNFAEYVGLTEEEVAELCSTSGRNFSSMKKWYDGYAVGDKHSVYNPYSVMRALESGNYKSY